MQRKQVDKEGEKVEIKAGTLKLLTKEQLEILLRYGFGSWIKAGTLSTP